MPEGGLISRFFRYLARFFADNQASITAAPVASAAPHPPAATVRPLTQPAPVSTSTTATVSTSSAAAALSAPQVERKAEMHTTITRLAQQLAKVNAHTPLIKFIGARQPRPHFDRSSLPPLVLTNSSGAVSSSGSQPQKPASSIGPVGSTPRGSGIDESQLPAFLRRRMPDADEIAAINIGSAYGR